MVTTPYAEQTVDDAIQAVRTQLEAGEAPSVDQLVGLLDGYGSVDAQGATYTVAELHAVVTRDEALGNRITTEYRPTPETYPVLVRNGRAVAASERMALGGFWGVEPGAGWIDAEGRALRVRPLSDRQLVREGRMLLTEIERREGLGARE